MRKLFLTSFLSPFLIFLFISSNSVTSKEENVPKEEYIPNEVLVKFKKDVSKYFIQDAISSVEGTIITYKKEETSPFLWDPTDPSLRSFRLDPDLFHIKVPETIGADQAIYILNRNPNVKYVQRNWIYHPFARYPNDEHFNKQWALFNKGQTGGKMHADINAPDAWNIFTGSSDIVVAVIDSGVDYDHIDLQANIWINWYEYNGTPGEDDDPNGGNGYIDDIYGWDFYDGDNDPMDGSNHGTHVAGIIGAVGNNGVGVTGVNWSVKIMALKVGCTPTGGFSNTAIVHAIDYATENGAHLSNNSYGGGFPSQAMYEAIERAKNAGRLFIAAAGNEFNLDNDEYPYYPASYGDDREPDELENIIAVAATTNEDLLANYSHYGANSVDLGAPGGGGLPFDEDDIYSTTGNNSYTYLAGTSQAAPYVAGVAALAWGCL